MVARRKGVKSFRRMFGKESRGRVDEGDNCYPAVKMEDCVSWSSGSFPNWRAVDTRVVNEACG